MEGWRGQGAKGPRGTVKRKDVMGPRGEVRWHMREFYDMRHEALNCGKRFVVVFVFNIACHKHAYTHTPTSLHRTYTHTLKHLLTQMNWIKLDSLSLCKQNFNVFLLLKSFTQTQVELCSTDSPTHRHKGQELCGARRGVAGQESPWCWYVWHKFHQLSKLMTVNLFENCFKMAGQPSSAKTESGHF